MQMTTSGISGYRKHYPDVPKTASDIPIVYHKLRAMMKTETGLGTGARQTVNETVFRMKFSLAKHCAEEKFPLPVRPKF